MFQARPPPVKRSVGRDSRLARRATSALAVARRERYAGQAVWSSPRVRCGVVESAGVFVITGAMASGKSTIAQALAARLPRAAHVRGDAFRRMIVSGRASTDPPLGEAARAQLDLRQRLAALVADEYVAAGIAAIVQDLYLGDDLLRFLRLLSSRPVHVIVLFADPDVLEARDRDRGKRGYGSWSAAEFHRHVLEDTPRLGLWIDTSGLTVEATLDRVTSGLPAARVELPT